MQNIKRYIGIDISKSSFDACFLSEDGTAVIKHYRYDDADISQFVANVCEDDSCVMEATGTYHLRLATSLYNSEKKVFVVNPLSVSHFSKMRMNRAKTDSKDAATIADYAKTNDGCMVPFVPDAPEYVEVKQLLSLLDLLQKQQTQLRNQEEALKYASVQSKMVKMSIREQKDILARRISKIEKEIGFIIDKHSHDDFVRLQGIPGIGKKTAAVLIATTSDMRKFENSRQVCSYYGLCPRLFVSGSSVHGKSRICKMGMSRIRRLLYMCAWSAIKFNASCRSLYERLVEKGKAKMVALVAVAYKLVKIAFSLIKNQTTYDANFFHKKPCFLT